MRYRINYTSAYNITITINAMQANNSEINEEDFAYWHFSDKLNLHLTDA